MKQYRLDGLEEDALESPDTLEEETVLEFCKQRKLCALEVEDISSFEATSRIAVCGNRLVIRSYFVDNSGFMLLEHISKQKTRCFPEGKDISNEPFWIRGFFGYKGRTAVDKLVSNTFVTHTGLEVQLRRDGDLLKILSTKCGVGFSLTDFMSEIHTLASNVNGVGIEIGIPLSNATVAYL